MKTEEELIWESYNNINNTIWYHGSPKKYNEFELGGGIDGGGIYLTKYKDRAIMYAQTDKLGNKYNTYYIHQVKVNLDKDDIWDTSKKYDLSKFTNDDWLMNLIKKHGDNAKYIDGGNAKIYLGFNNNDLIELGYKAILTPSDLIILDKSTIKSSK